MTLTLRSGDVGAFLGVPALANGPVGPRQLVSKSELKHQLSGFDRDVALFTIHRDGRPEGRILVHALRPTAKTAATAAFAHFDCADDPEAAQALIEIASSWARARGLARIVGPVDLADLSELGAVSELSVRFLHDNGFAALGAMTRYRINPTALQPPEISPAEQAILDDPDFSLAMQSKALQPQRLSEALVVLNEVLGRIAPFMQVLQLRCGPPADPTLCIVLHHRGRPVGCCLGVPDKAIQGPKATLARMWPSLDRLTLFGRRSPPAVTILTGILPQFHTPAIGQLLWSKALLALIAGSYTEVSTHCTANLHGLDTTQAGVTVVERLQLFSKPI